MFFFILNVSIFQWKFITPLKDVTVKETEEAIFECELNIPNVSVTWTVNGQVIEQSPKHILKSDKTKHTLIIVNCIPKDKGEITCTYAHLQTKAGLTVKGMYTIIVFHTVLNNEKWILSTPVNPPTIGRTSTKSMKNSRITRIKL